jgi:hypothetical protein
MVGEAFPPAIVLEGSWMLRQDNSFCRQILPKISMVART